jgi:hypothetical protein
MLQYRFPYRSVHSGKERKLALPLYVPVELTALNSLLAGPPMCAHSRVCATCHVLWNVVYVGAGIVQLVAGIFFLISLPIFKMGSNIWAGAWVSKWMLSSQVKASRT